MRLPLGNGQPASWRGAPRGGEESGVTRPEPNWVASGSRQLWVVSRNRPRPPSGDRANARLSRRDAEPANVGYAECPSANRPAQNGEGSADQRTDDRLVKLAHTNPADSATLRLRKTSTRNEATTSGRTAWSIAVQVPTACPGVEGRSKKPTPWPVPKRASRKGAQWQGYADVDRDRWAVEP
jgi:hypothetical protein